MFTSAVTSRVPFQQKGHAGRRAPGPRAQCLLGGCQLEAVGLTRPENSVCVLDTLLSALSALSQNPHHTCLRCAVFPTPRL